MSAPRRLTLARTHAASLSLAANTGDTRRAAAPGSCSEASAYTYCSSLANLR